MKKLAVKKNVECMACLECVRACSTAFYKEFHPDLSCIQIVAKGTGAKPMTCISCGKCMKVCEHGAITQNPKGVYMINKKECVGCYMCVGFCPEQVMYYVDGRNEPGKCTACGICVKACPVGALSIQDV